MHCCISTPPLTVTLVVMAVTAVCVIWVTLNMTTDECHGGVPQTVRELSENFTLSGEWSPWLYFKVCVTLYWFRCIKIELFLLTYNINSGCRWSFNLFCIDGCQLGNSNHVRRMDFSLLGFPGRCCSISKRRTLGNLVHVLVFVWNMFWLCLCSKQH